MSDQHLPPGEPPPAEPIDELASAVLDGEATTAEQTRSEEPEVVARIERFEAVGELVRSPVDPAPDEQREAAIAAALGAWGQPEASAPVDELAGRRRRTVAIRRWVGVAAVAIGVIGLGTVVLQSPDDDATTAAGTADTSAADESAGGELESDAGDTGDDTAETESEPQSDGEGAGVDDPDPLVVDEATGARRLGAFDDADALLDQVVEFQVAEGTAGVTTPTAGSADLAVSCNLGDDIGDAEVVAVASIDGRPVIVLADGAGGERRLTVIAADDCAVLRTRNP